MTDNPLPMAGIPESAVELAAKVLQPGMFDPNEEVFCGCSQCEKERDEFRGQVRAALLAAAPAMQARVPSREEVQRTIREAVTLDSCGCCQLQFASAANAVLALLSPNAGQARESNMQHTDLPAILRGLAFHWREKGFRNDADVYDLAAKEIERFWVQTNLKLLDPGMNVDSREAALWSAGMKLKSENEYLHSVISDMQSAGQAGEVERARREDALIEVIMATLAGSYHDGSPNTGLIPAMSHATVRERIRAAIRQRSGGAHE